MYGQKIFVIRQARGFTQSYMAKKLGIEQSSYARIESNEKKHVSDDELKSIAAVLGVSIDDIKNHLPVIVNFSSDVQNSYRDPLNLRPESEVLIVKLIETLTHLIANQNKLLEYLITRKK